MRPEKLSSQCVPLTRRDISIAIGLGLGAALLPACSKENQEDTSGISNVRMQGEESLLADSPIGFWFNSGKCVGCGACVRACSLYNGIDDERYRRRWLVPFEFSDGRTRDVSFSCMHCKNPACVSVCPVGAISKRDDGVVLVEKGLCIGCKYCFNACPFGIPRYPIEGMDKCDCCVASDLEAGQRPFCVEACNNDALHFGALEELESLSDGCAKPVPAPTSPSYLLS